MLAAGVIAGQLERALNGLRAGVAIEEAMRSGHGRHGREALGEIRQRLVVEVGAGDVDQLGGLLLNGGDHFGMAMAGGGHGDAGGEVEKLVAVHVFHADAAAALGHQRIGARITGRNQAVVGGHGGAGLGSGQRTNQLGSELGMHLLLGHLRVSSTSAVVRLALWMERCTDPGEWGSINLHGDGAGEDLRRSWC